jgi:hypothetical protein
MSITVSRIDGDNFVVQSKFEKGVVTVRVVLLERKTLGPWTAQSERIQLGS